MLQISVFIGEKALLHVTEGKWKKWRKSNAPSKALSRNRIQTNAVSLWPLQTEAIWEGDVSSALYSCVWELGSAAAGGWGEGPVRAWRCCFQNEEASSKGGIRCQGPFTLLKWRGRWAGVGDPHRWPLWVVISYGKEGACRGSSLESVFPVNSVMKLWWNLCGKGGVGEWHLSCRVLRCSRVMLECWLPGFITSV